MLNSLTWQAKKIRFRIYPSTPSYTTRIIQVLQWPSNTQNVLWEIRSVGSQRLRLYRLPKIYKHNIPLWPILSIVDSAHLALAKWLADILEHLHSQHCISDSFTLANLILNISIAPNSIFFCFFHIVSLYTNVPLEETITICADAQNRCHQDPIPVPEPVFLKLIHIAAKRLQFILKNTMYQQTEGIRVGSPLGFALVNIFVGFHEARLLKITNCFITATLMTLSWTSPPGRRLFHTVN